VALVVAVLTRLIVRAMGGTAESGQTLATLMLAEYQPETVRELRLAGEAIGLSLDSLAAFSASAEPGITADQLAAARRWNCSLSRAGSAAHRRLDELQRARRAGQPEAPDNEAPDTAAPDTEANLRDAAPRRQAPLAAPAVAAQAEPDLAQAEASVASAATRLHAMKSRFKGAPPPHSQAAQQIRAQERVVATARLKLEQVRARHAKPAACGRELVHAAA
jgi:hypothetical protein